VVLGLLAVAQVRPTLARCFATPLRTLPRNLCLIPLLFLTASLLPAQTLQQAETLWQQHRMMEANEVFRVVCDQMHPQDAGCKVRWGRMYFEYGHSDEAFKLFDEALSIDQSNPGAVLGEALLAADEFGGNAAALARRALALDPHLLEAQELLARLALEDNDNSKAAEEARKALAMDPNSVGGKAVLASIDLLADKPDTSWDPHTAKGYEIIGHFFMLNRRYEESIKYYRQAVELDPQLSSARSELGIDLMRLGRNDEASRQLQLCWDSLFHSKATENSLTLLDSFTRKFVTFTTPRTILRFDRKEGEFLRPYFQSEMERVIAVYEKKYKMKLEHPVQVEAYPDHDDFAVRTLGMPGFGALGVTFGYTIAMDSPSGRPPGHFHWASTLWHEMSHVFTLSITNSHVPRWFTEGVAVHEETAVNPEWGDRLGPDEIAAIKEHQLLPVAGLDRGFIHPSRPQQIVVSYFQAGRICDFIVKEWGWDTILAMLHDYAQDDDTPTVIRKELKLEPAEFDKRFLAALEAQTKVTVDHFDEWKKSARELAGLASKAVESKDKADADKAIQLGRSIENWYTEYVEDGSVYELLAATYLAVGDRNSAIDELWRYVRAGGRNPKQIKLLASNLEQAGRNKEAADALERLNFIYPMDPEQHQKLGDLWLAQGNAAGAIREYQAVLARNPIDPAQAHFNLARAYRSNRQVELAKDEVLAALEIAPGFRPAQKLLLELN
jgi:tetratricopeptide (TPR) repeat protein